MTIYLENICKSYNGNTVLDNFNARIEWDTCYAVVGPAGCGKTTLLKLFMGIDTPDSGAVHKMGDYKYPALRSAYVPQESHLILKKNALKNVKKAYRRAGKNSASEELLKFLSEDKLSVPVSELTPCEQRFVEIVCALFVPADFIVLDEPFLGMNENERQKALNYILDKRGSRPLLIAGRNEDGLDFVNKTIRFS